MEIKACHKRERFVMLAMLLIVAIVAADIVVSGGKKM